MGDSCLPIESTELVRQLDRHLDAVIWVTDRSLDEHRYLSGSTEELLGHPPEAFEEGRQSNRDHVHPDDRASVEAVLDRATDGASAEVEYRLLQDGAQELPVRTEVVPLNGEAGDPDAITWVTRRLSDADEQRRRLRDYERAIEGTSDLIVAIDSDERLLFANEAYCDYLGIESTDVAGNRLEEVLDRGTYRQIKPNVDRALAGETVSYRMTRRHARLGPRIFDIMYYPLDDSGDITGAVAALRDVTTREERTQHLEVLNRVLRHNLRNDLTVIRGLAEEFEAVDGQVATIIDDLLETTDKGQTITKILTERPPVYELDIAEMVRSIVDDRAGEYEETSIELEAPDAANAVAIPAIDAAFEELITNAVVHTDSSAASVTVSVDIHPETVQVTVADDGPGIPQAERDILRTGEPPQPLEHGSGLGLWLIYWAVRRSQGTVSITDRQPTGTVIEVSLSRPT